MWEIIERIGAICAFLALVLFVGGAMMAWRVLNDDRDYYGNPRR